MKSNSHLKLSFNIEQIFYQRYDLDICQNLKFQEKRGKKSSVISFEDMVEQCSVNSYLIHMNYIRCFHADIVHTAHPL